MPSSHVRAKLQTPLNTLLASGDLFSFEWLAFPLRAKWFMGQEHK